MTLKAIAVDIDGTLLNDKKNITPLTKEALSAAQNQGLTLILASGRPIKGMRQYAEELRMNNYKGLLVSDNGSLAVECKSDEILFNKTLPVAVSQEILEHLKKFDIIAMIIDGDYLYTRNAQDTTLHLPEGNINVVENERRNGNFKLCEKPDLAAFVDFPLNKILIAGQAQYLQENHKAIQEPFTEETTGAFSSPFYFEFTAKGVDKATPLKELLPQRGIRPENVIAFGNGNNDCSLIKYAGVGIAMGNAVEELKEVANDITSTNNEDGIAVALEKYL